MIKVVFSRLKMSLKYSVVKNFTKGGGLPSATFKAGRATKGGEVKRHVEERRHAKETESDGSQDKKRKVPPASSR